MDPITQGALGAAAAQAATTRALGRRSWLFGALGGMAADLDIFIRSSSDPLLSIQYHRHFTHSLAFVPIGGLIVALPWILRSKHRHEWRAILTATTIGYATHGLLDAFTSYGTLLYWPFSTTRVAWNTIGIVDLAYTVPLLIAVFLARRRESPRPAIWGLVISSLYMALCGVQRARVVSAQERLVASRGHTAARAEAFPTPFNNVTWRSLYEHDGTLYADRLRVPWFGTPTVTDGKSTGAITRESLPSPLLADPEAERAFGILLWFSKGWVGRAHDDPRRFGDVRYSIDPGGMNPMWGLTVEGEGEAARARWATRRRPPGAGKLSVSLIWTILFEDGPDARPI